MVRFPDPRSNSRIYAGMRASLRDTAEAISRIQFHPRGATVDVAALTSGMGEVASQLRSRSCQ